MSGYKTIKGESEYMLEIERSKFLCHIKGVRNEDEAKDYVTDIRKRYSDASHHCYAYIADEKCMVFKFSDDREPQGTAGLPILNVLKQNGVFKTVAVVTRWFGGIKLGVGGLARAYSGAVEQCLNTAVIVRETRAYFCEIIIDYPFYERLQNLFGNYILGVIETDFSLDVRLKIAYSEEDDVTFSEFCETVFSQTSGRARIEKCGGGYYCFNGKYVKNNVN